MTPFYFKTFTDFLACKFSDLNGHLYMKIGNNKKFTAWHISDVFPI